MLLLLRFYLEVEVVWYSLAPNRTRWSLSKEKLGLRFDFKMANIELALILGFNMLNVSVERANFEVNSWVLDCSCCCDFVLTLRCGMVLILWMREVSLVCHRFNFAFLLLAEQECRPFLLLLFRQFGWSYLLATNRTRLSMSKEKVGAHAGFKLLNVTECVNFKSPYYIRIRKLELGIERLSIFK
jgi:hypothetical protein